MSGSHRRASFDAHSLMLDRPLRSGLVSFPTSLYCALSVVDALLKAAQLMYRSPFVFGSCFCLLEPFLEVLHFNFAEVADLKISENQNILILRVQRLNE